MLTEGFNKNAEALNKEINRLKQEIEATKNQGSSWFSWFLDTVGTVFTIVLPGPAKLLGLAMRFISSQIK